MLEQHRFALGRRQMSDGIGETQRPFRAGDNRAGAWLPAGQTGCQPCGRLVERLLERDFKANVPFGPHARPESIGERVRQDLPQPTRQFLGRLALERFAGQMRLESTVCTMSD